MEERRSEYRQELRRRGFQEASIESEESDGTKTNEAKLDALGTLRNGKVPHFLYSRHCEAIGKHTIAFDECGEAWICFNQIDLTYVGFAFFNYQKGKVEQALHMN